MSDDLNALWAKVRAAENEAEAVRGLAQILSSKEGRMLVLGLALTDRLLCIEILDHVRQNPLSTLYDPLSEVQTQALAENNLPSSEEQVFFGTLMELKAMHGRLLDSMKITEKLDIPKSPQPYKSGGFADIKQAQYNGHAVAVKTMRVAASDDFKKIRKVSEENVVIVDG